MNSASENLPHHLGILRERIQHPTNYELAVHYFLEEFAGDTAFLESSEPDDTSPLLPVITQVVSQALGQPVQLDATRAFRLRAHQFHHGNATIGGRVVLFLFMEALDTGILALIPGVHGAMEVARFRLTRGLTDPREN